MRRRVLVVGAGIAGATAAHWLARSGADVTVVERSAGRRSSGSPVDVRGPALAVVERMGVLPALRCAATRARTLAVLDGSGRVLGRVPFQTRGGIEVGRAELAAVLVAAARDDVEFRWGDSVTTLVDDGAGVDVAFERGDADRFDLVVGADGLHSRVRALAFGPEEDFVRPLGLVVATVALAGPAPDERTVLLHNAPGRAVSVHPATGPAVAAFVARVAVGAEVPRDRGRQEQMLAARYAGVGWRAPELLARAGEVDDLYVDAVCRVRMSRWARGRVVLVGDAASCVSLLGEGSSLAIAGAATLARALAAGTEVEPALRRYEDVHRRRVTARGRGAALAGHLLVPSSRAGLAARNLAVCAWPAPDPRPQGDTP